MPRPIYVEICIQAPLEALWERTQRPDQHERWDLRFTGITYLDRVSPETPQRFLYTTRIGFGIAIAGTGESTGTLDRDGARTSALRFESDDPKSLILEGSGYWRYVPTGDGVRFFTMYDYTTRFGVVGAALDLVFRPLLGWATAWSFDRLRLWLERGLDPSATARAGLIYAIARGSLALTWVYQGLAPKLAAASESELLLTRRIGVQEGMVHQVVVAAGLVEVAFGVLLIVLWPIRGLLWASSAVLLALILPVVACAPGTLVDAFNPVSLTAAMWALAAVAGVAAPIAPSCATLPKDSTERHRVSSIYQRAMGTEFAKLHPQIQRRFGFGSEDGVASIGRGVMDSIWRGALYTVPFLYVGTWRRIMFPENGREVPFTIHNYAYRDRLGRETVTWIREFRMPRVVRRFDATMIYSERRGCIVDYLGSHQHLAVDIHLSVGERGGLRLRSGDQRFYEGLIGFRFPLILSGVADVCEWFDDEVGRFRIEVRVTNRQWGPLFGYTGCFDAEFLDCRPESVPADVKPLREERRE